MVARALSRGSRGARRCAARDPSAAARRGEARASGRRAQADGWICAGDDTVARGRGVAGEALNGSG